MNNKINVHHLNRRAYIYVRQSTASQVAQNLESQRLQYGRSRSFPRPVTDQV